MVYSYDMFGCIKWTDFVERFEAFCEKKTLISLLDIYLLFVLAPPSSQLSSTVPCMIMLDVLFIMVHDMEQDKTILIASFCCRQQGLEIFFPAIYIVCFSIFVEDKQKPPEPLDLKQAGIPMYRIVSVGELRRGAIVDVICRFVRSQIC